MERVLRLASENAAVIFSLSSCCMCHTVKTLLADRGVRVTVYELDEEPKGREMEKALAQLLRRDTPVPAVFIGGQLVGSTDEVMSLHLTGSLLPLLRRAGALWV
ncbi:hypothetical protein H6P81_004308 [Aristolochia fimbriata]|uniref:Glutaredoxin domain-containing protein n=1 Tax=Aristolochia fimbriata TaxID=158543 RepID=A0AAV7FF12_ARIFI|nr:hypothetical protein H6P81_004308 [Aristolochia fimbriata]